MPAGQDGRRPPPGPLEVEGPQLRSCAPVGFVICDGGFACVRVHTLVGAPLGVGCGRLEPSPHVWLVGCRAIVEPYRGCSGMSVSVRSGGSARRDSLQCMSHREHSPTVPLCSSQVALRFGCPGSPEVWIKPASVLRAAQLGISSSYPHSHLDPNCRFGASPPWP